LALAMFDLDHTLLDGDSDGLWGEFLVAVGALDEDHYRRESARYNRDYRAGQLDADAYYRFSLAPLGKHSVEQLTAWRHRYIREAIHDRIADGAQDLLTRHRDAGHTLMIITATNRFLTEPIAKFLGVDLLIATEPEMIAGRYTGRLSGTACMREGKVSRLQTWLEGSDESLTDSWFYSDSNNDLPLLEKVDHPVAVNPDPILAAHARARQWPVIELRRA